VADHGRSDLYDAGQAQEHHRTPIAADRVVYAKCGQARDRLQVKLNSERGIADWPLLRSIVFPQEVWSGSMHRRVEGIAI
jgi:hypothetical protein